MIDGPLPFPKGQLMILWSTHWKREGGKVCYQRKESFVMKYQSYCLIGVETKRVYFNNFSILTV